MGDKAAPARLERWWPEQRCAEPGAFGTTLISPVRPDGHGILAEGGHRVAFFAEFDSGLKQHSVLLSKVGRYAVHVARGGPAWPVLFWLPTTARERRLHQLLAGINLAVPVATAARDSLAAAACAADRCGWWSVPATRHGGWWIWPISATVPPISATVRLPDHCVGARGQRVVLARSMSSRLAARAAGCEAGNGPLRGSRLWKVAEFAGGGRGR